MKIKLFEIACCLESNLKIEILTISISPNSIIKWGQRSLFAIDLRRYYGTIDFLFLQFYLYNR